MNKSASSILGTMNLYMPSPERKESKVSLKHFPIERKQRNGKRGGGRLSL